jgi:hypothetical protein
LTAITAFAIADALPRPPHRGPGTRFHDCRNWRPGTTGCWRSSSKTRLRFTERLTINKPLSKERPRAIRSALPELAPFPASTSWGPTARLSGNYASPALMIGVSERTNRAENSHQIVRRRERKVQRLKSSRSAQAFSQHPFRRPQHLQPSATSRLSVDASDPQSRSSRPVARCGCRRVNQGSTSPTPCTRPVP